MQQLLLLHLLITFAASSHPGVLNKNLRHRSLQMVEEHVMTQMMNSESKYYSAKIEIKPLSAQKDIRSLSVDDEEETTNDMDVMIISKPLEGHATEAHEYVETNHRSQVEIPHWPVELGKVSIEAGLSSGATIGIIIGAVIIGLFVIYIIYRSCTKRQTQE